MAPKARIVITCSQASVKALAKMIDTVESLTGEQFDVIIDLEGKTEPKKVSHVQYRALAGAEALKALGNGTVNAIIFSHLLNKPMTARQLEEATHFTKKSVQSGIHRLQQVKDDKDRPIITVEEIAGA